MTRVDDELVRQFPDLARVVARNVAIPGPHGDVDARLYTTADPRGAGAVIWIHGGGFLGGDLDMPEANWVSMVLASRGFPTLSVDYRKAVDGVHYPVPLDDVLAAWTWATAHSDQLGTTVARLHLAGASAGANLAAGATKRVRDGAGQPPRSLLLVYPIVHAELPPLPADLQAAVDAPQSFVFSPEMVRGMNLNYVGTEEGLDDPYAFPANGDLSGLPPTYILNSDLDTLRASGEAYGVALESAGVAVRIELEPETLHGHVNEPAATAAQRSVDRMVSWLTANSD